jgi:hypothetical protein
VARSKAISELRHRPPFHRVVASGMFAEIETNPTAMARGAVPRPIRSRAYLRLSRRRNHMTVQAAGAEVLTFRARSSGKLIESSNVILAKMFYRIVATAGESG